MNATSRKDEIISILALGKNRQIISQMLEGSGLKFTCDWIDHGEEALKENYHDVAVVSLGDRSRSHMNPICDRDRKALSLLCSMGIPAVIIGCDRARRLLEGISLNWDWTFVSERELDSDHLLHGIHDALQEYVTASGSPGSSHRFRAWVEMEDSGID